MVFLRPSFGAYAPPSPNSWRNLYFLRRVRRLLMIILPSGILSRRMRHSPRRGKQLSAQCATLPEGESFLSRHLRAPLPEGESSYRHRVSLSPKEKAFSAKREDFLFSDSAFAAFRRAGRLFISSTQSKQAGRLSII